MVHLITNLSSAKKALIEAVNAVTKDNNGANDKWHESLKSKADTDKTGETQKKVTALQFFDGVLRSSINPNPANEEELGRLVSEIQGYQVLTERFILDLSDLTGTAQPLEEKAAKERSNLFESLNGVQNWLLTQNKRSNPSEFDACTNQFLGRMQLDSRELDLTQQLFNNQSPELREFDPRDLTDAWGTVVSGFVEDAQDTNEDDALNIGEPKTIASFFCIHERLETLYGRLDANVSLVD